MIYVVKEKPAEPPNKSFEVIGHTIKWYDRESYYDTTLGVWFVEDSTESLETLSIYISPDLEDTAIITTPKRWKE